MRYVEHSRRGGGRPSLNRERRPFRLRAEPELIERLQQQAAEVGLSLGPYMELIMAQAHDYHGEYLAEVQAPLPTAVSVEELRQSTIDFAHARERGALRSSGNGNPRTVRSDKELADIIDERCRTLDVAYSDYLRALFREAAGMRLEPADAQQQAVDFDAEEGEPPLRRAS